MAKIGLAAELAKQAAQAAREEMTGSGKSKEKQGVWAPPVLPWDFNIDTAVTTAVDKVAAYYRFTLAPEGLGVSVVTEESQGVSVLKAGLHERGTGRLVKEYTAPDLLSMYAGQQRLCGVVVDGQV